MKDLEAIADNKNFHNRIVERHGAVAFIAGHPVLVNEIADRALQEPCSVEINRDQLELINRTAA